jgi:hypothetical protein
MCVAMSLFCVAALSDEPVARPAAAADAAAPSLQDKWRAVYRSVAESIEMECGDTSLTLEPRPLLFYTNPVRTTDQNGAVFLWTLEGRAAVFGAIWSSRHPQDPALRSVHHEWHSLLERSDVRAVRDGRVLWTSGEPGIAWQSLSESPAPAESRVARLVQMRSLVRRLRVEVVRKGESELRLMTQPLYRYPESTPEALDGAVFVFGMGTDPELIALVELREQKEGPAWSVAFARFSDVAMTVRDGERTLWTCERATPYRTEGKYYLMWRAEHRPADPEEIRPVPEETRP